MKTAAEIACSLYKKVLQESLKMGKPLLYYEITKRSETLLNIAKNLESFASNSPATLLRDTAGRILEIAVQIQQMAKGINSPFLIFTVGMGKYGKSTLVNALLGLRVAEMDVLPKTWKIDIFTAQRPPNSVLIKYRTGEEFEMSIEEAKAFLAKEEDKYEESMKIIREELKKNLDKLKTTEEKEEYKAYLKKRILYHSPVIEVHWPVSLTRLTQQFNIVDTPGLFQEFFSNDIRANIRDYYHKADGVLWMLDATKISAKKSFELIKSLDDALEEIGGRTDNIIGVLNRIDLINPADREKVIEEAFRIFENRFCDIIPFSAKQALIGVENNDQQKLQESGYYNLLEAIEKHFLSKALLIQKKSKILGFRGYINDAVKISKEYYNLLIKDEEKRINCENDLEKDLKIFEEQMKKQINNSLEIYRQQVHKRIDLLDDKLLNMRSDEIRNNYIKKHIIKPEQLEKLEKEIENSILINAKDLLNTYYSKSSFKEFPHLSEELLIQTSNPNSEIDWSKTEVKDVESGLDNLSFITGIGGGILAALLINPLVGLIFGVLSFTDIGKAILAPFYLNSIKSNLKHNISNIIDECIKKYEEAITKIQDEIKCKVTHVREKTFAELHSPSKNVSSILQILKETEIIAEKPFERISVYEILKGGCNIAS